MRTTYNNGTKLSGVFDLPDGTHVNGELTLQGANTTLELFSTSLLDPHAEFLTGTLSDRTRVSLIRCVPLSSSTRHMEPPSRYHSLLLHPQFILLGTDAFASSEERIPRISFSVDDAPVLLYDPGIFGSLHAPPPELSALLEATVSSRVKQNVRFADDPMIFYYTGKDEFFRAPVELGTVSASNNLFYAMPGPAGIKVENQILISVAFSSAIHFDDAVDSLIAVLRFLELIVGRPQKLSGVSVVIERETPRPVELDVYWCSPPDRGPDDPDRRPHPMDVLISGGLHPEYFTRVMQSWFGRHAAWREPRLRFTGTFNQQNRYDIDRLVAAANMFDILPDTAFPPPAPLPHDLADAQRKAREIFEELPESQDRNMVLQTLSRMGKTVLKRKIRSRLSALPQTVRKRFPHLETVLDEAVNCRNHFVHGSKSRIDYGEELQFISFFTNALEFVFATSDLVECGWDMEAWLRKGTSMTHPFGSFLVNYSIELEEFRRVLPASHSAALPSRNP